MSILNLINICRTDKTLDEHIDKFHFPFVLSFYVWQYAKNTRGTQKESNLICFIFRVFIRFVHFFKKGPTDALGFMNITNCIHKFKCFYWLLLKNSIQGSCDYAVVYMGRYGHIDGSCMELDTLCTGISFWKNYRPSTGLVIVPVFLSPCLIPLVMTKPFANAAPLCALRTIDGADPPRAMLHFLLRLIITVRINNFLLRTSGPFPNYLTDVSTHWY
jgi:hypothetical protein